MMSILQPNLEPDPFKEYSSRVFIYNNPDFDTDAAWLRKKLKDTSGNIYISSGEANYQVYNQLENEFRYAVDENHSNIFFLGGPLVSIPSIESLEKRQDGRELLNIVIKLAYEKKLKLYPSPHRQKFHYRVLENEAITNLMEPHPLGIKSTRSWFFYGSRAEAEIWKRRFLESIDNISPVSDDFANHFIFLTEEENSKLEDWAKIKNIDVNKIKIDECRDFWNNYIQQ